MSLASDPQDVPEDVEIALPHGTWADDERLWLKPVYDVYARESARHKATIEVQDGYDDTGKPKIVDRYIDQGLFYLHLVIGHITRSTIKARRKDGTLYIPKITPKFLTMLGPENNTFLFDTVLGMAGVELGSFLTTTDGGKVLSFRGPSDPDPEQPPAEPEVGKPGDAPRLDFSRDAQGRVSAKLVGVPGDASGDPGQAPDDPAGGEATEQPERDREVVGRRSR